ncbi:MAG: type IV CRISPR-associated protein Csf3 [Bacteroidota bacterium]
MQNLRIDFKLLTPINAPTKFMHLDAILAWCAVQQADYDLSAQDNLPLEKHIGAEDWCWKSSCLVFEIPEIRGNIPYVRKYDIWNWGLDYDEVIHKKNLGNINNKSGPYKAFTFCAQTLSVKNISAWCVGNKKAIETLLDSLTHIGKLTRMDLGRIMEKSVVEDKRASELWKMRTMPDYINGYKQTFATLRPPYWQRSMRKMVWQPTDRNIKIKSMGV